MKLETVIIRINALENAAALIEGHVEMGGLTDSVLGSTVMDYGKQCDYVAKMLNRKAKQLIIKYNLKEIHEPTNNPNTLTTRHSGKTKETMSITTYTKRISRREIVDIEIFCPFCKGAMLVENIYTKKYSREFKASKFEGTTAICKCNNVPFFSYDAEYLQKKVSTFDTSKPENFNQISQ